MQEIRDIPVKVNNKVVGKALLDGNGKLHISFDGNSGVAQELVHGMTRGMIAGLSVGPEITPVTRKPTTEESDESTILADKSFQEAMVDVAGERIGHILRQINDDFHGTFVLKQSPPPGQLGEEEIEDRFGFHKASIEGPNATAPMHAALRTEFSNFANWLDTQLPGNREKVLAFDLLETASMWSHKALARLSSGQER